ncbi:uncharacterized PE-PGRS family protein PE_PGRS20-like, partial [Herpailurus yagouaroundi]|uniref:uncharacterized PE-PGRS family protein PE_PGRS20-like n=1 Tax=Herpailurus yagouaroundi TaxID=1608482 RepID=UPI001AD61512
MVTAGGAQPPAGLYGCEGLAGPHVAIVAGVWALLDRVPTRTGHVCVITAAAPSSALRGDAPKQAVSDRQEHGDGGGDGGDGGDNSGDGDSDGGDGEDDDGGDGGDGSGDGGDDGGDGGDNSGDGDGNGGDGEDDDGGDGGDGSGDGGD